MSILTRESAVSLSTEWRFSTDPDDIGVDEGWYDLDTVLPGAHTVVVPHAWQEHEELREYTGTAWYRRSFSFDCESEGRTLLRFGAVDYEATVWVNGIVVGSNRGGYLPFVFDITDALRTGENVVAVRVHDPENLTEIPHGKQGVPWYTRVSGIWQDVALIEVPETYIASVQATPDLAADAVSIAIEAVSETDVVSETNDDFRVRVSVTQDERLIGSAERSFSGNDKGETTLTVNLDDPTYWTPETPALCDFEVEFLTGDEVIDTYSDYFGMRTITVKEGEWYLNGEPLRVRGALDQAYYPDTFYRPDGSISYRREIEIAKELGFNMLRKHIKPAHPKFVELADRLGILVWEEPANPDVFTERSKREVREQFEGMVERDYNRPSVIVWSLYNEEWGIGSNRDNISNPEAPSRLWNDEDKQEYLSAFYNEACVLDPTRLICDNSGWAHVETDINDYHEYFIVPDRAAAWKEKLEAISTNPGDNYATTTYDDPEKAPIVMSEFGTWGFPDVERLRDHAGDPHWFTHDFLEGLKRPAGIDQRFAESTLSDAFTDLSSLATAWQRRELASIEEIIRDMRISPDVSGYVLTEFTDIEWEFNGILGYRREPKKELIDDFAAVNAPVTGWLSPHDRVYWDNDSFVADLAVVNDTPDTTTVTMEWEAFDHSEVRDIELTGNEVKRINRAIDIPLSAVDTPQTASVTLRLLGRDVTSTSEIVVVPSSASIPDVTVAADAPLADNLTSRGYEIADPATADVTIRTGNTTGEETGDILLLPDEDGRFGDGDIGIDIAVSEDDISIATLPERESWNLCASFVAQTLFEEIDIVPGWAFEDLYPYTYVHDVGTDDTVQVAYTEGWVANSGAISLTCQMKNNKLGICSLRLVDGYGGYPMATAVLDRLLEQFE